MILGDRELTWDIRAVNASDIPCFVFGAGEEEGGGCGWSVIWCFR